MSNETATQKILNDNLTNKQKIEELEFDCLIIRHGLINLRLGRIDYVEMLELLVIALGKHNKHIQDLLIDTVSRTVSPAPIIIPINQWEDIR